MIPRFILLHRELILILIERIPTGAWVLWRAGKHFIVPLLCSSEDTAIDAGNGSIYVTSKYFHLVFTLCTLCDTVVNTLDTTNAYKHFNQ